MQQSLNDLAFQKIDSYINDSNECIIYKHVLKNNRLIQPYLNIGVPKKYKDIITKFRFSAHSLNVETGRYDAIARENRICTKCDLLDIEDEFHFILKCPFYTDIIHIYGFTILLDLVYIN